MMPLAQITMGLTLLLMISGRTPLYLTAIAGSGITALIAGFPITGKEDITIAIMVNGGLNPVIADMAGVLLFIGIMQASGFLDVIIRDISDAINPVLKVAPVQIMLLVAVLMALMTQSYGASAAVIIPFLQVVLTTGADPMATGLAAVAPGARWHSASSREGPWPRLQRLFRSSPTPI